VYFGIQVLNSNEPSLIAFYQVTDLTSVLIFATISWELNYQMKSNLLNLFKYFFRHTQIFGRY